MHASGTNGIGFELNRHNTAFSLVFIGIFTASFVFLNAVGFVPDPAARWQDEHGGTPIALASTSGGLVAASGVQPITQGELPIKIVIDAINLTDSVGNPTSADNTVMNQFLKSGAVRYPTSSQLGVNGTVLLFGHSSYLPIVANHAYKTFDGIQNLNAGDEISVYSSDREYRYTVTDVSLVHASDGTVALRSDGQYLTLVTCDSFDDQTQNRWIVEAKLVGIYSLANS